MGMQADLGHERAYERLTLPRRALGDHPAEVLESGHDDLDGAIHVGSRVVPRAELLDPALGGRPLPAQLRELLSHEVLKADGICRWSDFARRLSSPRRTLRFDHTSKCTVRVDLRIAARVRTAS